MENNNFFSGKFLKNSLREKQLKKVYFQKKINTEQYPSLQKNLKAFFNDYSKYFDTSFENNRIIVGKKYSSNHKLNSPVSSIDSNNNKFKGKKTIMRRPTIKKPNWLRKSDSLNISKYDDKK